MPNPDLIPEPFAQSGDKNTIPLERAIADPVYRASWRAGFPPDTRLPKDVGGEAPDGLDFNGLFNALSQAVVFLQKGNAYQFDAALAPYPIGALVRSNDNLTTFQSTIALNSNNPNSNMAGWRVYNGSGFIVDNLTTNDSAKALSAAQGKVLQDNKLDKTENAVSATKLQTARKINGVNFDGTSDIDLFLDVVMYSPIPYPKSIPPSGFLLMDGQAITQAQYPILYGLYGSRLPDMRAQTIRGWDNGRGIDFGRTLLSEQGDAIRNIAGQFKASLGGYSGNGDPQTDGAFSATERASSAFGGSSGDDWARIYKFDSSRVVPTAHENRVKNIAFNYIVKAG